MIKICRDDCCNAQKIIDSHNHEGKTSVAVKSLLAFENVKKRVLSEKIPVQHIFLKEQSKLVIQLKDVENEVDGALSESMINEAKRHWCILRTPIKSLRILNPFLRI